MVVLTEEQTVEYWVVRMAGRSALLTAAPMVASSAVCWVVKWEPHSAVLMVDSKAAMMVTHLVA